MVSARCLAILLSLLAVATRAGGQTHAPPGAVADEPARFAVQVDLVPVVVTVIDRRDRVVTTLGASDFAVYEDGIERPITLFAAQTIPVDVVLLIDSSGSVASRLKLVRRAAHDFVDQLGDEDRVRIIGVADGARELLGWTSSREAMHRAIESLTARGDTALYTGIYAALRDFPVPAAPSDIRRQAAVVVSDGEDTQGMLSVDDVLEAVRRGGVGLHTVRIARRGSAAQLAAVRRGLRVAESVFAMRRFAEESGGRAYVVSGVEGLGGAYRSLAEELRSQYVLAFTPTIQHGEAYRRLDVRVREHPTLRTRTRHGYYPTATSTAGLANVRPPE